MSTKKSATIVNVAKAAGVSVATASRVLSNSDYPISPAMRSKVLKAAKSLNYSPNLLGRMLKSANTKSLGIIIPSFQNPFYTQLIMGIEQKAFQIGYSTFVFSSLRDPSIERRLISQLSSMRISGLLLSSIDSNSQALDLYLESGGSACVFEADFPLDNRVINASSDMLEVGRMATEYLLSLGHTSIALLTTPLRKRSRMQIVDGYQLAMMKAGHSNSMDDVFIVPFERESDDGLYEYEAGISLANLLLGSEKKYTAAVVVNDQLACGVLHGLTTANVRVPEDISLVSVDNIPLSAVVTPSLTTVDQFARQLGQNACQLLVDSLSSSSLSSSVRFSILPELVIRNSACAVPSSKTQDSPQSSDTARH